MTQNVCNICNQPFNSEQELRDHQKTAHPGGKKEQERPVGERDRSEGKIAS